MISGKGSRDEKDAVQDFVSCCGYEATSDHVWAVPRGIVWDAWDRMLQEPWEGLPTEPRTADTSSLPHTRAGLLCPSKLRARRRRAILKACQVTSSTLVTFPLLRSYS